MLSEEILNLTGVPMIDRVREEQNRIYHNINLLSRQSRNAFTTLFLVSVFNIVISWIILSIVVLA